MAKTKCKQLAVLATIKVGFPTSNGVKTKSFQGLHNQASTKETFNDTCIENSPSPEVRQQRIINWVPPLDPTPLQITDRKKERKKSCSTASTYLQNNTNHPHAGIPIRSVNKEMGDLSSNKETCNRDCQPTTSRLTCTTEKNGHFRNEHVF